DALKKSSAKVGKDACRDADGGGELRFVDCETPIGCVRAVGKDDVERPSWRPEFDGRCDQSILPNATNGDQRRPAAISPRKICSSDSLNIRLAPRQGKTDPIGATHPVSLSERSDTAQEVVSRRPLA